MREKRGDISKEFAPEYKTMKVIEDAAETLARLHATGRYHFMIITARTALFDPFTREWVHRCFPGIFADADIHLTNTYGEEGHRRSKKGHL